MEKILIPKKQNISKTPTYFEYKIAFQSYVYKEINLQLSLTLTWIASYVKQSV